MKKIEISKRLNFPDDEAKFTWLPMLLDAYAIIDKGISIAIDGFEKKRKTKLACKKGCGSCCTTHKDIPVYPLELVGIYWYAIEKIARPLRESLKNLLWGHNKGNSCPFLIDGACSIHPFRPIACRQFNVFSRPCDEGEDPYYTRRNDVLTPIQEYTDRAFYAMLPFYGVTDKAAKERIIKSRLLNTQVRELQSYNWKELARRMDDFDFKKQ